MHKACLRAVAGSTGQKWMTRKISDWSSDWSTGSPGEDTLPTRWSWYRNWTRTTGTAGLTTSFGNIAMQILFYSKPRPRNRRRGIIFWPRDLCICVAYTLSVRPSATFVYCVETDKASI